MPKEKESPEISKKYRPNVALLLLNKADELLVCERVDKDGAWQFPQGGVDEGEEFLTALHRETKEEIGLSSKDYELIEYRTGYKYKYPRDVRAKKRKKHGFIGQEQTYFLCRLTAKKKKINVDQKPPEFQDVMWVKPQDFKLKWVPKFKRKVYKQVFEDFFNCRLS